MYIYVYTCIHIGIFIDSTKNASCMFRYHPWLGRFLTAILHRREIAAHEARERFPAPDVTICGSMLADNRMSGILTVFFFFSQIELCATSVLSSLCIESLLQNKIDRIFHYP